MVKAKWITRRDANYKKQNIPVACSVCGDEVLLSLMNLRRMERYGKSLDRYRCPKCKKTEDAKDKADVVAAILAVEARKKGKK